MITIILTVYEWTLSVVISILLYPIALVIFVFTAVFDKRKVILHQFSCFWATTLIWLQPLWKINWEGKENIKKDGTYVIISNHQSLIDILVIYSLFKHFKWVAKSTLLKVPLLGWNMALNSYIVVKRSDTKSQIQMMQHAERTLKSGSSVMIFPEGTRSINGEVGRFKRGAFILSDKTNLPVIPIALHNIDKTIKKNSFWVNKATNMRAKVFPPVYPDKFNNSKEMSAVVKEIITRQLNEWRKKD